MNLTRHARWLFGRGYTRQHFETFYSRTTRDAWGYEQSTFCHRRFAILVEMLPQEPIGAALEVGCAEGHFTQMLSQHAKQVVACDISEVAIKRAEYNCAGLKNVSFVRVDVREGLPAGSFDLILCSDVLYYLSKKEAARVLESFARILRPGALLMFSNEWHPNHRCLLNPQDVFRIISNSRAWERLRLEEVGFDGQNVLNVGLFRRN
jgi:SAM-dependent methyltransferase